MNGRINGGESISLPFRGALLSGGAMAFAGLGDAFLYPFLPIFGKEMGFSIFFVGLLLSVNRFVRILSNSRIANLVNRFGMKKVMIVCSSVAVITTLVYGLKTGPILFFIARVFWGLCYSGLKISTLNYAAHTTKKNGLAFGVSQSIKSLGALLVLWLGPLLVKEVGIERGLLIIALISSVGVLLAYQVPQPSSRPMQMKIRSKVTFYPSAMNLLVFMLSATVDGVLVITLSKLLGNSFIGTTQLLAIVAFYLLLKKLFSVGFSMMSGFLSLRVKPHKIFLASVFICIMGLAMIALGFAKTGIVLVFLFNSIVVTLSPLIAIGRQSEKEKSLQVISGVSTWWDLGAAIGAFIGIFMMEAIGAPILFGSLATIIFILFINFVKQNGNKNTRTI